MAQNDNRTDKLLIIRFSAMGDVAMMTPVVYSLARQYPSLEITVLSRPFAQNFFAQLAPNVKFIGINPKKEYKGLLGLNKLYSELRRQNFTLIADFHDVLRTKFLRLRFLLSGIKTAHIDKHRNEKRALIQHREGAFHQLPTSFDNYAEVLEKLGYPVNLEFSSIFKEGKADFSVLSDRIPSKKQGEKWIGIAPFAAHEGKIYPMERLKKVIDILCEKQPSVRIFMFGNGEKEHEAIQHLINNKSQCLNASRVLNGLSEELVLMSHLDAMLSMDSANMHLASLTGTRVVSIWGATHPYTGFLGWKQNADDVISEPLTCRPCSVYGNRKCRFSDYRCMNISPEKIAEKLLKC